MKRRLITFPLLVVTLVAILVFGAAFNPLMGTYNKVYADNIEYEYDYAYEVLDIVNAERRARGLNELKMSEEILEAAMLRATELADYFSHYRPNGDYFITVNGDIDDENIAWGYSTPEIVMNGWMSSSAHFNNITDSRYKSVGIGAVRINGTMYWTQEFSFYDVAESYPNPHDKTMQEKGASYERLCGPNRYETALTVAQTMLEQMKTDAKKAGTTVKGFGTVVIACGEKYPDALSGTYLASITKAPILLVNNSYENKVVEYIKTNLLPKGKVYILGGDKVVNNSVANKLKSAGFNVVRLSGKDRYETNLKVLEEINTINAKKNTKKQKYLVCSGKGFADSLSASSVSYPILLVGNKLTKNQIAFLSQSKKTLSFDIIGGSGVVSTSVEKKLGKNGTVERVAGKNRFETSGKVARRYFDNKAKSMVLTYGYNFPDGLAAGPFAYYLGSPVILVSNENYGEAKSFAEKNGIRKAYAIGGKALYLDNTVKECVIW